MRRAVSPAALVTVFGVIFIGELPDKTMFASLLLAARGRGGLVWLGAAAAFLVHVAIAVTIGGVVLTLLPHQVVQGVVALMFLVGAVMSFRAGNGDDDGMDAAHSKPTGLRTIGTAFGIIFIAEWGDLTQILTANLAARYNDPIGVGIAATLALWAVAGIAILAGKLIRQVPATLLRRVTAVVLLALAGLAAFDAVTGASTLI
ncbi:MAG TPA: TMEM165/GDT1 family protein [Pseudonocardiaceae bacterium]|nr:TMEM165/GDT1 family protein [Pseudonocardiaceae bacterium]